MTRLPPQPSADRLTPFTGHALVVGITPSQPDLVIETSRSLATATQAEIVCFAYVDPSRYAVEEYTDGTVRHESINPDVIDDQWRKTTELLQERLKRILAEESIPWKFFYLAGRPDRALTHLARAVDAAAIVVGTRPPGTGRAIREFFEGSVSVHLSQHQHRPVLTVPLGVVDWKDTASRWDGSAS